MSTDDDRSAPPTLYGRETERSIIRKRMNEVAIGGGKGHIVLLAGDSGVGKTALAQVVLRDSLLGGFDLYKIACEPFHEGMSFFPVRELVRQICGGSTAADCVAAMFGEASPQAEMAGVSESAAADPATRREAIVATFTNVIFGRFRSPSAKPLLFFIDDLEHLDTGSADALICVLARLNEGPVVILGSYRTDLVQHPQHPLRTFITAARRAENALLSVPLTSFGASSLPALSEALLGAEFDVPRGFYEKLFSETEGNPLFVREVLKALQVSDGRVGKPPISREDGRWKFIGDIEKWDVPDTVEDVIAARLDLLDSDQRSQLELAAVVGRRFAFQVLCALISQGEDELLSRLEEYLSFDLIREIDDADDSFEFSHGKIRDVLYASLSGLRKRRIHGQVAQAMVELEGVTNEDWDTLIGEHWYQAARHSEAFPYLLRAARNSMSTGSADQAVSLFRKALDSTDGAILEGSDTRQSIQLELAEALLATTDTDSASALLEAIISAPADAKSKAWALNLAGDAALLDGDVEFARSRYEQCEAMARSVGDRDIISEVCCDLAELHNREYERSVATDSSKAAEHRDLYIAYASEALGFVHAVSSAQTRARIYRNAAKRLRAEGDLVAARKLYEESLEAADSRTSGHRFLIPYAKALRLLGDVDGALKAVERVLAWSTQVGSLRSTAIGLQYRGLMLMSQVDDQESLDRALESLKEAARQHRVIGYKQGQRETDVLLGEVSMRMGNNEAAHDYFRRAIGSSLDFEMTCQAVAAELDANGEVDRAEYLRSAGVAS